ncbi:MAG: ribonuclease D [Saprospiraceae bacterium]
MTQQLPDYQLIETEDALELFYEANKNVSWLAFDTEFMGEKRYETLLCLVQVATENGYYLLDSIRLPHLDPFLQLVEDQSITKITHAGDNDYRLLHSLYGTIPQNIFDTQLAAGFVGYKYPVSFRKLVETELNIRLSKGYAVANWESRPFQQKQLKYALNDVVPLYELWERLGKKLAQKNRTDWAEDEVNKLTQSKYYKRDPYHEVLKSNMIKSLSQREQFFLMRLYEWRRAQAEKKNYSKEMILPSKIIGQIVRSIRSGKHALQQNRRIPSKLAERNGDTFVQLYEAEPTDEERAVLKRLPRGRSQENPYQELIVDMLNLLVRFKCLDNNISPSLVMPRTLAKELQLNPKLKDFQLLEGWRRAFLGEELINWLEHRERLVIDMSGGTVEMKLRQLTTEG